MTFEELLMVIDPNADGGEILELEFRGNEEYNRVRSDCVEILEPLFEYQVNSIGINDNGEQRIWLDPPKRADTPQTERKNCTLELFDNDGNYIEPQTDNGIGCSRCESRYDCYDRNMPHAVRCNNYGKITDEP